MRYRKLPVEIDAVLWTGDNSQEILEFAANGYDILPIEAVVRYDSASYSFLIHTLEGVMRCARGDYLIRGVQGEYYPCKPEIFEATYEPVVGLAVEPLVIGNLQEGIYGD